MITIDNIIHVSGIALIILIGASFITYTSKFMSQEEKLKKPPDLIYDPDYGANISAVCIFSKKLYSTAYENSPCHDKTLIQWYNPWLRHSFLTVLRSEINNRNRLKEIQSSQTKAENNMEPKVMPDPPVNILPKKENPEAPKIKTQRLQFIYALLLGLLTISLLFSCWEVSKEVLKKHSVEAAKSQECTLPDFNINRHRRRESQQPQTAANLPRQASSESTAKVTQTLFHQSSLDRAFPKTMSEVLKSMEARRNSVPNCLEIDFQTSGRSPSAKKLMKRQSVDVLGEEIALDPKRKSRHLIRRH